MRSFNWVWGASAHLSYHQTEWSVALIFIFVLFSMSNFTSCFFFFSNEKFILLSEKLSYLSPNIYLFKNSSLINYYLFDYLFETYQYLHFIRLKKRKIVIRKMEYDKWMIKRIVFFSVFVIENRKPVFFSSNKHSSCNSDN